MDNRRSKGKVSTLTTSTLHTLYLPIEHRTHIPFVWMPKAGPLTAGVSHTSGPLAAAGPSSPTESQSPIGLSTTVTVNMERPEAATSQPATSKKGFQSSQECHPSQPTAWPYFEDMKEDQCSLPHRKTRKTLSPRRS